MANNNVIQIEFPSGGVVRRLSYQNGVNPYTTPDAMNAWPDDAILERERGGSRAGTQECVTQPMTPLANPINMIADVAWVDSGTLKNKIVVASNGTLYYVNGSNVLTSAGTGLSTARSLGFADINSVLYIVGSAQTKVKAFDPATNVVADIVESAGTAPTNCTLAANFNNRLVLSGNPSDPHNIYFSALGEATDFDYGADLDGGQAIALNATDDGRLPEPVRALVKHSGDCLLIFGSTTICTLSGDPGDGGSIEMVSNKIGIHSAKSYCFDSEGWLYFLSNDAIYIMQPGCGSQPRSISRERIPQELIGISRDTNTVTMEYDLRFRGIILSVTKDSGTSTHYWIDTRTVRGGDSIGNPSIWPMQFTGYNPTACFTLRDAITAGPESTTWMGMSNGKVIRFNRTVKNDNGTVFDSYVDYGPIALSSPGRVGLLQELQITLAANSAPVRITIRTGNSAEEAFNATEREIKTFSTAGLNVRWHARVRGVAIFIRVRRQRDGAGALVDDTAWAIENIILKRIDAGESRLG